MESAKRYLHDIEFLVSDALIQTKDADVIMQDLNQGANGKYIYLVKKWTMDKSQAITNFLVVQ